MPSTGWRCARVSTPCATASISNRAIFSRIDTRPSHNVAVAFTGSLDYSGAEPHLAFGVAATRMPMAVLKRHVAGVHRRPVARMGREPHLRRYRRARGGRRQCAAGRTSKPMARLCSTKGCRSISRPAARPCVRSTRCRQSATPILRRTSPAVRHCQSRPRHGGGEPGRKLNVANGVFEVPDTHPQPSPARVHFRIDRAVPAAATLLATEGLRDIVGFTHDRATSRGTVGAQVNVDLLVAQTCRKIPRSIPSPRI